MKERIASHIGLWMLRCQPVNMRHQRAMAVLKPETCCMCVIYKNFDASPIIRITYLCVCQVSGARSPPAQMHSIYRSLCTNDQRAFERFTAFSFPLYFYLAKRYTTVTECDRTFDTYSPHSNRNWAISHSLLRGGKRVKVRTRFFHHHRHRRRLHKMFSVRFYSPRFFFFF